MSIEDREAIAREELAERFREERQAENDRLGEERDARLQAEADAKDKQRRDAEEAALKDRLSRSYRLNNPNSDDAEFDKLYPRIREEHLIQQARRDPVADEVAAQKNAMPAGFAGTW